MTLQVFLKPVEEFFLEQSKVLGQTDRRKDKWTRGLGDGRVPSSSTCGGIVRPLHLAGSNALIAA